MSPKKSSLIDMTMAPRMNILLQMINQHLYVQSKFAQFNKDDIKVPQCVIVAAWIDMHTFTCTLHICMVLPFFAQSFWYYWCKCIDTHAHTVKHDCTPLYRRSLVTPWITSA